MSSATARRELEQRQTKRTRSLITPEGLAVPMIVASRGSRLGALMLDLLIIIMILIVAEISLSYISSGTWENAESGSRSAAAEFLYIVRVLFSFMLWYGYFLGMELSPRGATWGKRMVGIRVAARLGGRLTPEAVIARNLLRDIEIFFPIGYLIITFILAISGEAGFAFIWAVLIWFLIFGLFPFFNRDAMRAGDIIAGTWVVEAPKTKLAEALSTQEGSKGSSKLTGAQYQFGDEELSVYGEHELQTLEQMLRTGDDDALSAVHETICRKIGWDPGQGDERAFLEAFYAQLRERLENDMRFGKRKADKYS
ncbi:MAG: RDD family protein [Pseudomonadota bacterium]|nr:RDD family protein [Pseudomonadota bacterium]